MHAITSWFRFDPRRLCVLGAWLTLGGLAVTATSLASGLPIAGLVAGISLSAGGAWAKVAGRDLFRRQRVSRHRAWPAMRADSTHLPPATTA